MTRTDVIAAVPDWLEVCKLVQAMKHYLQFGQVHADWSQKELLDKFGVSDFQGMADLAYDKADVAIAKVEGNG